MSVIAETHDPREASTPSLIGVVAVVIGGAVALTLLTGPMARLLGPGAGALPAAIHGTAAFLYLFVGTISLYLGWQLMAGRVRVLAEVQLLAVVNATLSLLAIVIGNWLYIFYRAEHPGGLRSMVFEFKEFSALYTLPLTVVAAFILWRYGAQVLEERWLRYAVAVLIGLSFFYLLVAFALGAAVTTLKAA